MVSSLYIGKLLYGKTVRQYSKERIPMMPPVIVAGQRITFKPGLLRLTDWVLRCCPIGFNYSRVMM